MEALHSGFGHTVNMLHRLCFSIHAQVQEVCVICKYIHIVLYVDVYMDVCI